jgi:uncharacterized protein YndB with AHSA1/START domain
MWKIFHDARARSGTMLKIVLVLMAALICQSASPADNDAQVDDMKIDVQKNGDVVVIDFTVTIAATPQETWAVMVDYDHMSQFLSNVQSSKILSKSGNKWEISQKGRASHGIFSFPFESLREVELKPFVSIRAHLISGTMKKFDGVTQLFPRGTGTYLVSHSESIADVWVPPMVGPSIIESEVRKQFQEMEAEILKRKANAKAEG